MNKINGKDSICTEIYKNGHPRPLFVYFCLFYNFNKKINIEQLGESGESTDQCDQIGLFIGLWATF